MAHTLVILFGISLLFALAVIGIGYLIEMKEGFQSNEPSNESDIHTFMTTASEYLCPTYQTIQSELSNELSGTDEEKQDKALHQMIQSAGGPLFPCPPPNEAAAVPADIDTRIQRTATFFQSELGKLRSKITKALDCPKLEGFQTICTETELKQRQEKLQEAAATEASKTCVAPTSLSPADKELILKTRRETLSRVLTNESILQMLVKVRDDGEAIKQIKQDALAGKLTPNCGVD